MTDRVAAAVEALRAGESVLLPTDTVYALASGVDEAAVARLYALKEREGAKPTGLIVASVDALLELVPELRGASEAIARELFPGPYTLVFPNPGRRYPWLTGPNPDAIGVRVAVLPPATRAVLDQVGVIAATSANAPGGTDPVTLDDVPSALREKCAVVIDAGAVPGTPSTVIDFTGNAPVVLREGAASSVDAIVRVEAVLANG